MLDADATLGERTILRFLLRRELSAFGFLMRHFHLNALERKAHKAQVLKQAALRGQGIGRGVRDPLVMDLARMGGAQKHNRQSLVDQEQIFHAVASFLAAIEFFLCRCIRGAANRAFGPVVRKRGLADSVVSRRCAKSATEREGVSPKAFKVSLRTGKRV